MPASDPGASAGGGPVVVIPALDAAATLPAVLRRLRDVLPLAAVIVVDDGSRDGTAAAAAAQGATVLRLGVTQGKGRALAEGVRAAVACGADAVVTMDADGQHPADCVPALLAPLAAGGADVVVGARRRDAGPMPWPRRVTNRLSSALVSRALGVRVPDSQSGFRAFTRRVAESVRPAGARYEVETEFLFLAAHAGFRIAAVPVPTVYGGAASHFRHGADTWRLSRVFLRHWRAIAFGPRT
jgi:glycosyltransferase involved in cell wall biosynthesis